MWARRALNRPFRRLSARAVACTCSTRRAQPAGSAVIRAPRPAYSLRDFTQNISIQGWLKVTSPPCVHHPLYFLSYSMRPPKKCGVQLKNMTSPLAGPGPHAHGRGVLGVLPHAAREPGDRGRGRRDDRAAARRGQPGATLPLSTEDDRNGSKTRM